MSIPIASSEPCPEGVRAPMNGYNGATRPSRQLAATTCNATVARTSGCSLMCTV